MIALALTLALAAQQRAYLPAADEARYYAVDYLTAPDGALLEVGGLGFLPDGRLAVSTRRGEVWLVEDALADDPRAARFHLYAEGLWEGLGLAVVGEELYVLQRGELSRLRDVDGDGTCDAIDTICDDWGLSGNYHEFAFGLPVDDAGNFYVGLNLGFPNPKWWHGKSLAPWRGWILRVAPDGTATPYASGFRSPCGLALDAEGRLLVTDNQGDWMPSCPIVHVEEGGFYGHPASLEWTGEYRGTATQASDTIPPARARDEAAIWLPYGWSRSTGNLVPDTTGGAFGPFAGQLVVAELTNGQLLRAQLEDVGGHTQGACFLLRRGIGSAARVAFAPDGTLLVGMTNRGWGGLPPSSGIARVRWTGETPMEIETVHLVHDGFELRFTLPLAEVSDPRPDQVSLAQYDYDWWWEYGSPERHTTGVAVERLTLSADRRTLRVHAPTLRAGMCARMKLEGILSESGLPLLHDELCYTVSRLPGLPDSGARVAKLVPPPPARESDEEGWLRLTWGDAFDAWVSEGWILCEAGLDPDDPRRFRTGEGVGALVNAGSAAPSEYVSKLAFGDARIHVEFMLPAGGNSGVYVQGRYEVQLLDSSGKDELGYGDCGGIYRGEGFAGRAPDRNAFRGPGEWHELDLDFEAPRFDERGRKVRDARFVRVAIDDVLLHEDVALPGPTAGGWAGEVPLGPLRLQGDHGPVAYRNLQVRPVRPEEPGAEELAAAGWVPLFDGESLAGWRISDEGDWEVEDGVIVGRGARSHLFSPRGDYRDFELHARVKISDGGNSGLYFRTTYGPGWPAGYEAQINSSYADPQKTGSLYSIAPVRTHLVPADTWFDYDVLCRDEAEGTRVVIRVDGIVVTDVVDRERRHAAGHVALQQHHEGSVVEVKDLRLREM